MKFFFPFRIFCNLSFFLKKKEKRKGKEKREKWRNKRNWKTKKNPQKRNFTFTPFLFPQEKEKKKNLLGNVLLFAPEQGLRSHFSFSNFNSNFTSSKIIHRHTFIRAWSLNLPVLSLCTPIRPSPTRASQPIGDGLDTILEAHCCCCHCRLTSTPLSAKTITPRHNSKRDINRMIMMMMMIMLCGGVVLLVGEWWWWWWW